MSIFGKYLIIIGLVIAAVGVLLLISPKIPYLGKLPGDIFYRKDNVSFYFPLTTSIIISVILSLILYLINRR